MAEFDQRRLQLQQSRNAASAARAEAAAAREKLGRLRDRERTMDRSFDPQNGEHAQARAQLQDSIQAATANLNQKNGILTGSLAAEVDALGLFGDLVLDPRQLIGQWQDDKPILMFPVRLETRFKNLDGKPELWVRVYPDDISIDTFEETLSENEVKNAQLYWSGIWSAGGEEGERREAWRALVGSHGSGRAEYIIRNYLPLSTPEPDKDPGDVILVIATESPLPDNERDALLVFWPALHAAGEDANEIAAARDALITDLGGDAARADALIEQYRPFNFSSQPAEGGVVGAEYLLFPKSEDLDVKRRAWSRAATASLLPDRFVFIGYNGGVEQVFTIGKPVITPLECSPDPTLPENEQLHQDPVTGELFVPEPLKWMSDFDRAVDAGMGFRIGLTTAQAVNGFDRVLVLGLRLSSDADEAKQELETLIEHHRNSRAGLQIVPQGTPTNNTEANSSGFSLTEDADESYDDLAKASLFTSTENWLDKQDGQWLAEYLGVDEAATAKIRNAGGRDQADARAMNTALWPATLGYWMDSMMETVFPDAAIRRTHDFFAAYVSGRGAIPALRVGRQPYGIVPATAFSRMTWMNPNDSGSDATPERLFLRGLNVILRTLDDDWRGFTEQSVSYAGRPGDPHDILLDIVGLHPASVHLTQRYAESMEQIHNRLAVGGFAAFFDALLAYVQSTEAVALLKKFGPFRAPEILEKFFVSKHHDLKGPVVDDRPLSEADPIRKYTADDTKNYLEWLIDAGRTSLDAVYAQNGFKDDKPPNALLYLMLRHAMQLAFHDASVRLLLQPAQVRAAKRDDPFVHVRAQAQQSESKYSILYRTESINGNPPARVGDYIAKSVLTIVEARTLRDQLDALERLKHASTARLERAFIEHIDTCTYRLDAWILGIVHAQLAGMRVLPDVRTPNAPPTTRKTGIYIGAYAWLEELRPDPRVLVPHLIGDPKVAQDFAEAGAPPLMRDSMNQGYIHAPSLNHAVAAAVLRNGYISNASAANRQTMAVNLTSERVRTALGMLEGIRGGQSLGALLGYQFERGLHDAHDFGVELDAFIFDLRREFPLRSNRLKSTKVDDDDLAIESIEARNVLDGLALMEHIRKTGNRTYPFGISRLPGANAAQTAAITAEADRMLESYDAVADLALAEGVYQAVVGNYDRVASTLDAYSKGNFPPEPQVVRTPFEGTGLTHRVALHLVAGANPNASPVAGVDPTPRSLAEPAVNNWLASVLPPFDQIGCAIGFHEAATNGPATLNVTLDDLDIQPLDLLVLLRDDRDQVSLTELDERFTRLVAAVARPDKPVDIRYRDNGGAPFAIFEVMPLVRHLRRLLRKARPLKATDMELPNEAKTADDAQESVDRNRIQLTLDELNDVIADLDTFRIALADPPLANADAWIDTAAGVLSRAAQFAIPQSGWAFAFEFRAGVFRGILNKADKLATRWTDRLTEYDTLIAEYDALVVATDEERFTLLVKAESRIAGTAENPVPATPAAYRALLDGKRAAFEARLQDFADLQNTTRTTLADFLADVNALLPIAPFDTTEDFTLADEEAAHTRFAEDALQTVTVVMTEATRRATAAQDLLDEDTAAVTAAAHVKALTAAAKVLLGDDFVVVPELALGATQGDELASAFGASNSLLGYLVNDLETPLPVDTWLYGVARVREPVRDLEQITMLAGAFGRTEPELTPMQLPFVANDRWLAMEFPQDGTFKVEGERLLYTAHFPAGFDKTLPQCGLLVDEWTELIPAKQTTTGVAVHYDRPNNEAPQALLLVTPPAFQGEWQWNDLVDALHETLDLAKRRAVEPVHFEGTAYAHFLPATLMAVTVHQLTISANLAINNNVAQWMQTP